MTLFLLILLHAESFRMQQLSQLQQTQLTSLRDYQEQISQQEQGLYTTVSWKAFESAYSYADTVNNDASATEPILWRILTVEDGKALVLSEKILTRGAYFNPEWIKYKFTYWSHSCLAASSSINYWGSLPESPDRLFYLTADSVPLEWYGERGPETDLFYLHARYWCNEIFYKEHLSTEEQERVLLSDLTNPDNPRFGTTGGPDTQDYVFFLSYEEVNKYEHEFY